LKSAGREAFHVTLKRELGGWFVATCKELPEAVPQGADREEVTKNIKEAIAAVLEDIYQSEVSTSDIEVVVEREE
jgi:predicted RNase H-like HicB family nuclease